MRLGVKHQNQQPIVRADFSGGLNTTANVDGIKENQLAVAINVEVDHATGRLKTVAGTTDILQFDNIFAAMYDEINHVLLLVKDDKTVYAVNSQLGISESLGTLSGNLYPKTASWEDGLLIASGSKLQYFNGAELTTIDSSPNATSVYIRAGRVLVTEENTVRYSGVGDETNWTEDTNDDSSSKFVEAGYKDGGELIGMVNLSTDVLLIKNNRRVYRLSGEFPNWQINEVSRNVDVSGRMSYCAISSSVFILGRNEVQTIQTTADYGDMKPQDVSTLITSEIQKLPTNTFLRYVPPLSQIWAINGKEVLLFDLVTQSWYKREFNSPVVDVITINDNVMIIKHDRVSKLDNATFYDAGEPLNWKWQGQQLLSQNDYLLKRTQVSFTPLDRDLSIGQIRVGAVIVDLPAINSTATRRRFLTSKGVSIYKNTELIYKNPQPIFNRPTTLVESRNVYRNKFLNITGRGSHGGMIFNSIILTIAEV